MAQKAPYDPEEGIIDLFEIVDDPVSPQSGLYGEFREEVSEPVEFEAREPAAAQDEASGETERPLSRYPFENEEAFRDGLLEDPAPAGAGKPEDEQAEPEARQEDDLIRAFEEEMAKAGSGGNEAEGSDAERAVEDSPEAEGPAAQACGGEPACGAFDGAPSEKEASGPEMSGPETSGSEMFEAEASEPSGEPCGETVFDAEAEGLQDVPQQPAKDDPDGAEQDAGAGPECPEYPESGEVSPLPAQPETQPADVSDAEEAECRKEEKMEPADGKPAAEGSCSVLNRYEGPKTVAGEQPEGPASGGDVVSGAAYLGVGMPGGLGGCLAQPLPVENAPAGQEVPGVEKRIIWLEEAVSRLNERVAGLERRVEDAEGQMPALSSLSGDIQSLLAEGTALCGQLKALSAELEAEPRQMPFAEEPAGAPAAEDRQKGSAPEPSEAPDGCEGPHPAARPEEDASGGLEAFSSFADAEPDIFGLALEALEQRVSRLEQHPEQPASAPDTAGIAQDVLALVRVDMEKAAEEQEASARLVSQLQQRVETLESRPVPQLILPELPDAEAITATVMARVQDEVDRIAAEAAARVLREEIANLMQK